MRVLFYLEPFPVRGRPLDFRWVFERWLEQARELVRQGESAAMVVSDALASAAPDLGSILLLSPSSLGLVDQKFKDNEETDREWVRLMSDGCLQPWRGFVGDVLDRVMPDVVLSWTINEPLRAETSARGCLLVHQELGSMRDPHPTAYFMDPVGVNGRTALDHIWPLIREKPISTSDEENLAAFRRECVPRLDPSALGAIRTGCGPDRRCITVFLQVRRDSNALLWSRVGGMAGLVRQVAEVVDRDRFFVLIKPHPGDPETRELAIEHDLQLAPEDISSHKIIDASDLIFTTNSSIGFEALLRGKVVYTFGDSVYANRGFTRDIDSASDTLRDALCNEPFNLSEIETTLNERFLSFALFSYLIPDREFWDARALRARLQAWLVLHRKQASLLDWFRPDTSSVRMRDYCVDLTYFPHISGQIGVGVSDLGISAFRQAAHRELVEFRAPSVAGDGELRGSWRWLV